MNNEAYSYRIPARPGRPRSPGHDRAILEAALVLMARDGYARMTIEGVAAAAGVSKAALYRRHRDKEALAVAALAFLREREPLAETGDPRADLVAELGRFRRGLERSHGMAMVGSVLAEEAHTPRLLALFREHVVAPRRVRLRRLLERCPLRDGVDAEAAAAMLVGSYYAEYLAAGPPAPGWEERAAAALLAPAT